MQHGCEASQAGNHAEKENNLQNTTRKIKTKTEFHRATPLAQKRNAWPARRAEEAPSTQRQNINLKLRS
jgi:hypothetical protein